MTGPVFQKNLTRQLLFLMTLGIKSFEPGPGIDWLALLLPIILRGKAESLPFQSRFYSSSGVDLRPDPVSLVYEISNPE